MKVAPVVTERQPKASQDYDNVPWLIYGYPLSKPLEKMTRHCCIINKASYVGKIKAASRVVMFYVDVGLDLLVARSYWDDGAHDWAAVCVGILVIFSISRVVAHFYQPEGARFGFFRSSVVMFFWNAFFATDYSKDDIDALVLMQFRAINSEGLFEAPAQLTFQIYVLIFMWGINGSPDLVQFLSLSISIASMATANANTFDWPYELLNSPKNRWVKMLPEKARLAPYMLLHFSHMVYRIISLSLVPMVLDGGTSVFVLLGMIGVRLWLFRDMKWDLERLPSLIVGSLFNDAFFGDAHFRKHLHSTTEPSSVSSSSVSSTSSAAAAGAASLTGGTQPDPRVRPQDDEDEAKEETKPSDDRKASPASHTRSTKKRLLKQLEKTPEEVSDEMLKVTNAMVWVAFECSLCLLLAVMKIEVLDGFGFDKFIVGRLAVAVGGSMAVRGALQWRLYYSPLDDLPATASAGVYRMFAVFFALSACCLGVGGLTGLVGDDCFEVDCGGDDASFCTSLTGTYACVCRGGYRQYGPLPQDMCLDIDECGTFTDTCDNGHLCDNTQGGFVCDSCGVGYAARLPERSECAVDPCYDGQLFPGELKLNPTGAAIDAIAMVGDVNSDGTLDLVLGTGAGESGSIFVVLLDGGGEDRAIKTLQEISSTQGGLVGPLAEGGKFGGAVTGLGDLDGDGVPDLAVGARHDNSDGGEDRGAVYVILLFSGGTVKGEQKISSSKGGLVGPLKDGDQFGSSVAGVGDVDGDGVNDLVVGAIGDDDGGLDRGAVYVLRLLVTGGVKQEQKISSTAGGLLGPLSDNDYFGNAITAIGDLNGDGVVDLVVGAQGDDDGGLNQGAVYVLLMTSEGSVKVDQKISSAKGGLLGPLANEDNFGWSVAGGGDLNGDGVNDLIVGVNGDDDGGLNRGAVYVLLMRPTGEVKAEQKISSLHGGLLSPLRYDDKFGSAVAGFFKEEGLQGVGGGEGVMSMAAVAQDTVYLLTVPLGFVAIENNLACSGAACFGVDCGEGSCVPVDGGAVSCVCNTGYMRDTSARQDSPCNSGADVVIILLSY